MAKYLLDTNVLVHYVRGSTLALLVDNQYGPSVPPNYTVVSIVSIGEMYSLAVCRKWGEQRKDILKKLLRSIPAVDINNSSILAQFAEIDAYRLGKHPEKQLPPGQSARAIGDNDLWIASTASVLKATLLTTDKDFLIFDKVFLDVIYLDPEKYKEKQ
ncbi:MAG TPA: type II toxin-antitoxin system VapC family toxin [Chitinivibrionales bacterium]|nr:type II toxin-antitoxin system VapC family toxin [Chitinivibrionales bacterium]